MEDELDFSLLPDELRHLAPLIPRYVELDDGDRTELLDSFSADELREVSEAPAAHWDAINAFLDEYVAAPPGPLQDLAVALGNFSEAAMEAYLRLEERGC
jgi:hypothetical protein